MPQYSAKRVQVLFRQAVLDQLEAFADEQGLTNSKAAALLVEEAMRARGILPDVSSAPVAATDDLEKTITDLGGKTVMRKASPLPTEDAQTLKLKLMQELMEQLKSM